MQHSYLKKQASDEESSFIEEDDEDDGEFELVPMNIN